MTCEICGAPAECEHHLIFGRGSRKLADEDKLTIRMCNSCHNMSQHTDCKIHENPMAEKLSKKLGQMMWERKYISEAYEMATGEMIQEEARREFMKRYGRSWLNGI